MNFHFVMTLSVAAALQAGLYAQQQPQRQGLEVQVQRLPSSNEGNYYDNSGAPQHSYKDEHGSYNQDSSRDYDDNDHDQDDDNDWDDEDDNDDYERAGNVKKSEPQTQTSNWRNTQNQPAYRTNTTEATRPAVVQQRPVAAVEQTLSIIKPDAVQNNHIGEIISRFEQSGLRIAAIKMTTLSKDQAGKFYQVHRDRPFYRDLVDFMSSGPVVILVLEGNQAITKNREIMGATDPKKADRGSLRADFAESVTRNAVHGSDSPETAKEEIQFFFQPSDISHR